MKPQTPPAAVVERSVDEYIAAAEGLLGLLAQERASLEAADAEHIARLAREKAAGLARLCTLSPLLRNHGSAIVLPGQRQRLLELLARCQQENQVNGNLLEARAQRTRRALARLQGEAPAQGYDRSGRSRYALPGRVSGRA